MKYLPLILWLSILSITSCAQRSSNGVLELYLEFWTYVDEHYIFFPEKQVDWQKVRETQVAYLQDHTTEEDLFYAMEQSLLELKDGHVWLRSPDKKAQSYNYRGEEKLLFSLRSVRDKYLTSKLEAHDDIYYGQIGEVAYFYIHKMKHNRSLEKLLLQLDPNITSIILDIRNNGGGNSNGVPALLGNFVKESIYLGAYLEKSGPGHTDVSDPLPVYAHPNGKDPIDLPVAILTNRGSYSASTYFATMFQGLPQVAVIGQPTGGGAGGNAGYELSNGWILAVSVSDFIDKQGNSVEQGLVPDILIANTKDTFAAGRDLILERALEWSVK